MGCVAPGEEEEKKKKKKEELDATITILLISESAQYVSGYLLPIFRSVRLVYSGVGCVFGVRDVARLVEQHPSHRTHSLRRPTPDLQPTTTLGQYTTLL